MLNPIFEAWTTLACTSPWDLAPIRFGISLLAPAPTVDDSDFVADRFIADIGSLRYKLFIPSGYDGSPGAPNKTSQPHISLPATPSWHF